MFQVVLLVGMVILIRVSYVLIQGHCSLTISVFVRRAKCSIWMESVGHVRYLGVLSVLLMEIPVWNVEGRQLRSMEHVSVILTSLPQIFLVFARSVMYMVVQFVVQIVNPVLSVLMTMLLILMESANVPITILPTLMACVSWILEILLSQGPEGKLRKNKHLLPFLLDLQKHRYSWLLNHHQKKQ